MISEVMKLKRQIRFLTKQVKNIKNKLKIQDQPKKNASHPLYEKLIPTESQIKKFVKCVPRLSSKYKVNYWNELDYVRS